MSDDRRANFRAAIEDQGGRLEIGGRSYLGTLDDESAGGFGFVTQGQFEAGIGAIGKFTGNNRFPSSVRVAYVEMSPESTRVGLQRTEMLRPVEQNEARGEAFRIPRWTMIAIGILAGLALGLLIVRQPWAT